MCLSRYEKSVEWFLRFNAEPSGESSYTLYQWMKYIRCATRGVERQKVYSILLEALECLSAVHTIGFCWGRIVGQEVDDRETALRIHTAFFALTVFLFVPISCWPVARV